MAQPRRIQLPVQETRVRLLSRKVPRAVEQLSPSSTGLSLSSGAREPQPPSPQAAAAEPELHRQRPPQ